MQFGLLRNHIVKYYHLSVSCQVLKQTIQKKKGFLNNRNHGHLLNYAVVIIVGMMMLGKTRENNSTTVLHVLLPL